MTARGDTPRPRFVGAHERVDTAKSKKTRAKSAPLSASVWNRVPDSLGTQGGSDTHAEFQAWLLNRALKPTHRYAKAAVEAFEAHAGPYERVRDAEIEVLSTDASLRLVTPVDFVCRFRGRITVGELKTTRSLSMFHSEPVGRWKGPVAAALQRARDADPEYQRHRSNQMPDSVCTSYTHALLQLVIGAQAFATTRNLPFEHLQGVLLVVGNPDCPAAFVSIMQMRHYIPVIRAMQAIVSKPTTHGALRARASAPQRARPRFGQPAQRAGAAQKPRRRER